MNKNWILITAAAFVFFDFSLAYAGMPPAEAKPDQGTAWFVVGIQPNNMRIEIKELNIKDGAVKGYHPFPLDMTMPVDGFIVFKAHPGSTYGIVASSAMASGGFFGLRYKSCHEMATFKAEGGKVVYFTTLIYHAASGPRSNDPNVIATFYKNIEYTQDLTGAKSFLDSHYPNLSNALEQGEQSVLPISTPSFSKVDAECVL